VITQLCAARHRRHFVWVCMLPKGHEDRLHDYAGSRWGEKDVPR
jgi:hypothetical protein